MSRRSVVLAVAFVALAMPAFGQYSVTNANSFDTYSGTDTIWLLSALGTPMVGNVAGTGIVNLTPADVMVWTILPKELMFSSNGTSPGTMELVSQECELYHSYWGSGPGTGTAPQLWDMTINSVTYTNPISGAGPDGRRYPNLALAPILTLVGGAIALPLPGGCGGPGLVNGYALQFDIGTAVPGSGVILPADGATDTAWCFWAPGGMSVPQPTGIGDPSGCEMGGNVSWMTAGSMNERVPTTMTTGAATPTPSGVSRNPLHGFRTSATNFNNTAAGGLGAVVPQAIGWSNILGFREPTLQGRIQDGALSFLPERGSGASFIDSSNTSLGMGGGALIGFRIQATPVNPSNIIITVLGADLITYSLFTQPGLPVTGTSNLLISPADPLFFFLTPLMDGAATPNTLDYTVTKDVWDTPLAGPIGPIGPPGLTFATQSFIVDFSVSPPFVRSTNVYIGNVR